MSHPRPHARPSLTVILAVTASLVAATAASPPPSAASPPVSPTPSPSTPTDGLVPLAADSYSPSSELVASFDRGRYIVSLNDGPSAVTTLSDSDIASEHQTVAGSVDAIVETSLTVATNGFVTTLDPVQAAQLSLDPRVGLVARDEILPLAQTSTDFLGLEGPGGVWEQLGGPTVLGTGVVVGVIDTGIAPENPSFAGEPLPEGPNIGAHRDGDTIVVPKSDGGTFRGSCQTGTQFSTDDCSTKLVGARYFVDGFGAGNIGGADTGEYLSPRDGHGHGSHVASTAAGNWNVDANGTAISGVTPGAAIASYKACWSGPFADASFDDGCALSDLLSAIDAATADGVDVLNFSIGGGSATTTASLTDQAFLTMAEAGIFVAAAAGNSGPEASSLDNASPWITTVAASTIPPPAATVNFGEAGRFVGATATVPTTGVSGQVRLGSAVARDGVAASDADLCFPGTLDPERAAGMIVVCDRGVNARTEKSREVGSVGGVAMLLLNTTPASTEAEQHAVPTVHIDSTSRDVLRSIVATQDAQATITLGNQFGLAMSPTPQITDFSSRGPVTVDGSDILKPDIAAPGATILAATASAENSPPTYGYLSGTSMASPHIAGLASMYLSQNATASPAEIKSALMTTATDTVDAVGEAVQDPFAQGAGHPTASTFLQPGLLYLNDGDDWRDYLASLGLATGNDLFDASDLNLPSIAVGEFSGTQTVTRTITSAAAGTWEAEVSGLPGITAEVIPSTLTFDEAGEEAEVKITFTRTDAPIGAWSTGFLTWAGQNGATDVRSPVALLSTALGVPGEVTASGANGSLQIPVTMGEPAAYDLSTAGLTRGVRTLGQGVPGGQAQRYGLSVPEGQDLLVIDLQGLSGDAELELRILDLNPDGTAVPIGRSPLPRISHRASLPTPGAGDYAVEVIFPAGQEYDRIDYQLVTYVIDSEESDAPLGVDPGTISGGVGDRVEFELAWEGLLGGSYLGVVSYGSGGTTTVVTIDAGAPPPSPAQPTLVVTPDDTEWTRAGGLLRLTATGLVPGASYNATISGTSAGRSGPATEDGIVDWLLTVPSDIDLGIHTARLTGPGTSLTGSFRVTSGLVVRGSGTSYTGFDGVPYVTYTAFRQGTGTVHVRVTHRESGDVLFDGPAVAGTYAGDVTTGAFAGRFGELNAVATVIIPGGGGPQFVLDPLVISETAPSSIRVTSMDADGRASISIDNTLEFAEDVTVIYQACDGTRIAARDSFEPGPSSTTWDLAGIMSVSVWDREQRQVFDYRNEGATSCSERSPEVLGQDLWLELRDPGESTSGSTITTVERPILGTVKYRYEPGISEFSLVVGQGVRYEDEALFPAPGQSDQIPVDPIEERGPVWSHEIALAEGSPFWLDLVFSESDPDFIYGWFRINAPSVTLEDLQPRPMVTFSDVTPGTQFFTEISWLAQNRISTGWVLPDGTREFRPVTPVARDAMAAFLYRLAGSPDFQAPETSPFTDVATDNQFFKEIAWLAETGISTGWAQADGTAQFRPLEPIARDAMAAFLYRFADREGKVDDTPAPATSPFADVATSSQFYAEIAWLAENDIATGWDGSGNDGSTIFRPLSPVNRDAMAAFMYRLHHLGQSD